MWSTSPNPLDDLIKKEEEYITESTGTNYEYATLENKYLFMLNERDRKALWLYFSGHPIIDIAKKLNVSQPNISALFKRLIKCMKLLTNINPLREDEILIIEKIFGRSKFVYNRASRYAAILRAFSKNCNQTYTAAETGLTQSTIYHALHLMIKRLREAGYTDYSVKIENLLKLGKVNISGTKHWTAERQARLSNRMRGNSYAHSHKVNLKDRRQQAGGQQADVRCKRGRREWFLNGERHRTDGPAIEYPDGSKAWFLNGVLHRVDGPAVEYKDGDKEWFQNGLRHRVDGPAIESYGSKAWYLNGTELSRDLFLKVTKGPVKKLPLYLGMGFDQYISEKIKN
jgi:DNA-binding transcriptional ArsR family regulator